MNWGKERNWRDSFSSIAHHILSSQLGREKGVFLWWDSPIRYISIHFSLNQTSERKNVIISPLFPILSLPPFPLPGLIVLCYALCNFRHPNPFFFFLRNGTQIQARQCQFLFLMRSPISGMASVFHLFRLQV